MSAAEIAKSPAEVDRATQQEWMREEVKLARKFHGRVPWEMVAWGLGNFVLWLSLWPLTMTGVLPLWAAFLIATVSICICYLPSHEAQHGIIGAPGSKLRWLNELVGHVSIIPLLLPYRIARLTHHKHHAHANDPESATRITTTRPIPGGNPSGGEFSRVSPASRRPTRTSLATLPTRK